MNVSQVIIKELFSVGKSEMASVGEDVQVDCLIIGRNVKQMVF